MGVAAAGTRLRVRDSACCRSTGGVALAEPLHEHVRSRAPAAPAGPSAPPDLELHPLPLINWIQTDTLNEGADGLRIGWEGQLSSAGTVGPRSVRARAAKTQKEGITPAWHTDRSAYADRHDTHWTRSNNLPAYVIAKTGDLRVISGFRRLDYWQCDIHAAHPCPNGRSCLRWPLPTRFPNSPFQART